MIIKMGSARKDATKNDPLRKPKVGVDEIKRKVGGEAGVVQQQRKVIESKKGQHGEEIALQKKEAADKIMTETAKHDRRETPMRPRKKHSSLNEEDNKTDEIVLERPSSNFKGISRPESRSRNTYVKLWVHKERHRNDQSPNRIKVKIGSISCGDTVRFLQAERARVIAEIRTEHEKRLGVRDANLLMEIRDKTSKQVEDTKEMDPQVVHDGKEAKGQLSDEDKCEKLIDPEERCGGQMDEERERDEVRVSEINEKQWTERDETCLQELRSLPMSEGKIIQKSDKEQTICQEFVQNIRQDDHKEPRVTDENTLQKINPKADKELRADEENKLQKINPRADKELRVDEENTLQKINPKADKELGVDEENTLQKINQKADKELRVAEENTLQPEAKVKRGAGQEEKLARVATGQVQAPREQADSKGPKRGSRPIFDLFTKSNRTTTENSTGNKSRTATFLFHPPSSTDFRSYKSCQGDKWGRRFENGPVRSAEANKGRASNQGEGEEEEKELQRRALFHLEALRRIEESYIKRRSIEKSSNARQKYPNEMPLHRAGCGNNNYYSEVHQTQKHQLGKLEKKGKGGLNALLAPVFEEEIQRHAQDLDPNSPTNSYTNKRVLMFQRMKKAQLRSAEEQIAAAKARAQQSRAQLEAIPTKLEMARAVEQEAYRKDQRIGGECFNAEKDKLPTKQAKERLFTSKPSTNYKAPEKPGKYMKEQNEKASAEEELEAERGERAKIKDEEMRTRLRKGATYSAASVELYSRLSNDGKMGRSALPLEFNSRCKSPLAKSQKLNSNNGLQHPRFSPLERNGMFRKPLASPRKDMKSNAIEHFANWEKELRTAQRSKSRSNERRTEKRISMHEDPMQDTEERENPGLKSGNWEQVLMNTNRLCYKEKVNKSPPRNQSPVNILSTEAIPDHYNSIEEGCTCDVKYKREVKEKTRAKVMIEKTKQSTKGSRRRENCHSLNWLGKLYNTITSFS